MGRLGSTPVDGCAPLGEHLLGAWVIFAEGLSLGEARGNSAGVAAGDGLSLGDARASSIGQGSTDGVALGDAAARAWEIYRSVVCGLSLGDARASSIGQSSTDGVTLADARAAAVGQSLADGVALGDAAARAWEIYRSVVGGLSLSDSKLLGEILMGEILGVPDMAFVAGQSLGSGLALSDALVRVWNAYLSASDGLQLADARAAAVGQALADGVILSDAEVLLLALALTLIARSGGLSVPARSPGLTLPERGG